MLSIGFSLKGVLEENNTCFIQSTTYPLYRLLPSGHRNRRVGITWGELPRGYSNSNIRSSSSQPSSLITGDAAGECKGRHCAVYTWTCLNSCQGVWVVKLQSELKRQTSWSKGPPEERGGDRQTEDEPDEQCFHSNTKQRDIDITYVWLLCSHSNIKQKDINITFVWLQNTENIQYSREPSNHVGSAKTKEVIYNWNVWNVLWTQHLNNILNFCTFVL